MAAIANFTTGMSLSPQQMVHPFFDKGKRESGMSYQEDGSLYPSL